MKPKPTTFAMEMRRKKGTVVVPFFFSRHNGLVMIQDTLIKGLEEMTRRVIENNPDYFLVELRIKPTNNVKVFLDADHGVGIHEITKFNRSLYKMIEESGVFPAGDFSLEVSSPGLDEPLKLHRQYVKNIGRHVEVSGHDGSKKEGKMIAVTDNSITLEYSVGKGKKAETVQNEIQFDNIKSTKIQVVF
jgi:ribosome maturation factor RimP